MSAPNVRNGQVWEAPWPDCKKSIIQWVDGNRWMLLSTPERSTSGGTCMVPCTDAKGRMFYTREELAEMITLKDWKLTRSTIVEQSL